MFNRKNIQRLMFAMLVICLLFSGCNHQTSNNDDSLPSSVSSHNESITDFLDAEQKQKYMADYAKDIQNYMSDTGTAIASVNDVIIYSSSLHIAELNNKITMMTARAQIDNMDLTDEERQSYLKEAQSIEKNTDQLLEELIHSEIINQEAQNIAEENWALINRARVDETNPSREMVQEQYDLIKLLWETWGISEDEYINKHMVPIYKAQGTRANLYNYLTTVNRWGENSETEFESYIANLANNKYRIIKY